MPARQSPDAVSGRHRKLRCKIPVKPQGTQKSQNNLGKCDQSGIFTSKLITEPQWSKQRGAGVQTDVQIDVQTDVQTASEPTLESRDEPQHSGANDLPQGRQDHAPGKGPSSFSTAVPSKLHAHMQKEVGPLPYTIYKN